MSFAPISPDLRTWRAVHVHVPHSRHTAFLCDAVAPLLRTENLLDRFFFLRYWQGGPHLRLRLLGGPEDAVDRFAAGLAGAMPEFGVQAQEEYAYGLTLQAELARLENETEREGNPLGAIEPEVYEPEYGKYGGVDGIAIAETVFRETSVAVLDVLAAQTGERAPIGEAARVMAMFLGGAGVDPGAATAFLHRYEDWWRRYAPEEMQRAWPELYRGVAAQLTHLCAKAWDGGAGDVFHATSAAATARARTVCDAGPGADVHDLYLAGTPYPGCLSNYVHTTNNRLGLVPAHEGLVAYLVRRALEDLAG